MRLIVTEARRRGHLLPNEADWLQELLNGLLSREDCQGWLGYKGLQHSNERPPVPLLASLVRDPDLGEDANVDKVRLARGAAFIDCFHSGLLDWQKPDEADMKLVLRFIEIFTHPDNGPNERRAIIRKLFDESIPFKTILKAKRASRVRVEREDLYYIWETRNMRHEDRAVAWDNRAPEPFQPFGRPNLEMHHGGKKLQSRWRTAVNRLLEKARKAYGPQNLSSEHEPN